ncbi:uncharacterized protein LOC127128867 [Lathyrus oleraceus]|uniref:Uncharacterized protein n=1 Tax=Pisum sativum TaxID=3888 RepID=A0A9D4XRK1_PEA|nr:uncharacterized protein LOC127128867 [Pisum sativum]KAI5423790.1 hypothetical protein KIW84_030140 [Pisum sativum]
MDSSLRSSFSSFNSTSFPFALTTRNMLPSKKVSNETMQELCYLQNGGGLTENAISTFLATLPSNPTFLSAIVALFVTQSTKVFLNFCKKKRWNFRVLVASQGMPSTRSALCSALTTSVALTHGVAGPLFPVSLGFGLIVMCDTVAVKRHVGYQALVLNTLLDVVFQGHSFTEEKLEQNVGDTLPQVLTGALIGSTVAILCSLGFMLLR